MKHEYSLELERIYQRDGSLDPKIIIAEARSPESPLHDCFNWDDEEAADQHRLNQARQLIRVAVKVLPSVSNAPVRQFVSLSSLRGTETGSYLATVDVLSDDQRRAQALQDAITALQGMQKRFRYLPELTPIWDALAQLTSDQAEKAA